MEFQNHSVTTLISVEAHTEFVLQEAQVVMPDREDRIIQLVELSGELQFQLVPAPSFTHEQTILSLSENEYGIIEVLRFKCTES